MFAGRPIVEKKIARTEPIAMVLQAVSAGGSLRKAQHVPGPKQVFAVGMAQGRRSGEDHDPLLPPMLIVIRRRSSAGIDLDHGRAQPDAT